MASVVASFDSIFTDRHIDAVKAAYKESFAVSKKKTNAEDSKAKLTKLESEYAELRRKISKLPDDLVDDFAVDLRTKKSAIESMKQTIAEATAEPDLDQFDAQFEQLHDVIRSLKAAIGKISTTHPHLVRELIASIVESIELDVADMGKGKNPRWVLADGEITLKPAFNLIAAS